MTELENKIKYYADNYYQGNELISDSEYDALLELLKTENPNSELLTGVIGSDMKGITKKYKLPITMGTLSKYHTPEEFRKWYNDNNTKLHISLKVDGNSQLLIYKNGKLVQTLSRGDSEYGEDTTKNVLKVNGVIKEIPNFTGCIRGEVVLKNSVFEKYFSDNANARNMAAGIIKRLDGKDCEKLNFVAYEVNDENNQVDKTEEDKIAFLKQNGFEAPKWWCGVNCEDIIEFRNNLNEYIKEVDYNCDGLVIKYNNSNKDDLQRKTPTTQVAFKPESTFAITTLKDIEWNLQGSIYSPVGILEPIELDGTTVSRVTLHNLNIMEELGISIGCKVKVIKSGMIIPKVLCTL